MTIVTEHKTTIDGVQYKIRTLPTTVGLVVLPKIIAMVGEPVVKLLTTDDETREELFESPAVIAAVLMAMAKNAAETDGLLVVKDLMAGLEADKVRIGEAEVAGSVEQHFDTHFAGRYKHLASVVMWLMSAHFIEL